jgi:bidirectional [NiFe] hydrogenase diaphorase subunit
MKVLIDGRICEAEYGEYILAVAKRNGIDIPTLCHHEALTELGTCRLCIVELVKAEKTKIVASCIYPITHELEIRTDSSRIFRIRKIIMKLLLSRAPENAYLNSLALQYGLQPTRLLKPSDQEENCILCGLCVKACEELGANAISTVCRGTEKKVSTTYDEPSPACVGCGSCATVCPTRAIVMEDKDGTRTIWGKTFSMLKCKNCGEYFAPNEYIEFVGKRLGQKLEGEYCSSCRKAIQGTKYRDIYGI